MEQPEISEADARALRFLRGLVLVLTATMIVGIAVLIVLFLTRFPGGDPSAAPVATAPLRLPDTLTLPEGAQPIAVTQGPGWWAVVTDANEILIFESATGALRQRVPVE